MAEISQNYVNLLYTDARKWFSDTLVEFDSLLPYVYSMATSDKASEIDVTYSGVGNMKRLDGNTNKDTMTEEYRKDYEFPEYANSIDIRRPLLDDRREKSVMNMVKEFGLSAART